MSNQFDPLNTNEVYRFSFQMINLPHRASRRTNTSLKQPREVSSLPTRLEKYPSGTLNFSKWFIHSLILLFIVLISTLGYWGMKITSIS